MKPSKIGREAVRINSKEGLMAGSAERRPVSEAKQTIDALLKFGEKQHIEALRICDAHRVEPLRGAVLKLSQRDAQQYQESMSEALKIRRIQR
jgi:hypothetical protein